MNFIDYKYKENTLNFTVKSKEINGIYSKNYEDLIQIINLKSTYKGKIKIDNEELNKENIKTNKEKIRVISKNISRTIYYKTTYELLYDEIIKRKLSLKNPEKKIKDSIKIVGLDQEILNSTIYYLSTSEKKLVQIAIALLSNPSLIILEEPFKVMDIKNQKKLIILLNKIKEQYNKTIVIASNSSNLLYKYSTNLIIFKNEKILIEGSTQEIFQRVEYLNRNKIKIPEIVEFTYIARKKKNVDIDYHRDIRDIIKDIYKHV